MRRKIYLLITILLFALGTGCSSSQTGDAAELSQADKDAAVEVVTKHLEGRKNDFGVISLAINSVQTVENAQHLQNILEDEDAAKMGLTKENIALVDAYINVQHDGTIVSNQSGDNVYIGFTLIRQDKDSPWLINNYGQGLGGVAFMDYENPYPERSAELYVWKNKALTGNDNTYFTVLSEQTNEIIKNRKESEIYDLAKASDDLNYINLQLVGIPNLTYLAVYQMNTTDFTKREMSNIVDQIILNADNHRISIGLWEPESATCSTTEAPPDRQIFGGIHLACLDWTAVVVSLTKEGEQLISGHNWHTEFAKMAKEIALDVEMSVYAMDDMYTDTSQEPIQKVCYANLSEYSTLDGVIDWIAIGGDWQPFPCKVRYERYTLENQPQNEVWTEHFAGMLTEDISHTPVVITEAWFFDLDGDGRKEAFVNAGNAIPTETDAGANPPPAEKTGLYSFSTLFSESLGTVDLNSDSWPVEHNFSEEAIHASYTEPINEKYFENFVAAIQYGGNGEYIKSPIFNKGEYGPPPRSYPIVADIDGDGQAELLRFRTQIYGPLNVYGLQEGELVLRYAITVSA